MKSTAAPNSIRFGLFVFIFLIFFCLAQLTWWIIYQIDLNRDLNQHRIDILTLQASSIVDLVNHDFRQATELAGYAFQSSGGDREKLLNCLNNILADTAVIGYEFRCNRVGEPVVGGIIDSTFYSHIATELTLYFNPDYPHLLTDGDHPNFIYSPTGQNDGMESLWVQSDMFEISPEVREWIENESQKGPKMFIFEGGFFMLIVLFGAYLIYRTLQKSEDLKARQVNFIQSVTHEFRTPLTSLRLYLETMQSGRIDADQSQQLYVNMIEDCDRLDGMVDNVLEAGYLGREKYDLELSETNLAKDLDDYINDLKPYIKRQNGSLTTSMDESIRVRSDYDAFGRAIRALIDNALRYSPQDRRNISVRLEKAGKDAVIIISDQGIGIASREQKKIFDRFYRVDTTGTKGTGLGLYLVRHIVEAHDGTIMVDSDGVDRGSRFTIKLPLVG